MAGLFTTYSIHADVLARYHSGETLSSIDRLYGRGTGWAGKLVSRARAANRRTYKARKPGPKPGTLQVVPTEKTPSPEYRAKTRVVDWDLVSAAMRGVA